MERAGQVIPGDTVIGVFAPELLPNALAVVHRERYGLRARVLNPERGSLALQLRRAGLPDVPEANEPGAAYVLLVVSALGRAARAANLLAEQGAHRVYVTTVPAGNPAVLQPLLEELHGDLSG